MPINTQNNGYVSETVGIKPTQSWVEAMTIFEALNTGGSPNIDLSVVGGSGITTAMTSNDGRLVFLWACLLFGTLGAPNISLNDNSLDQTSVDAILVLLAGDIPGGHTHITGGNLTMTGTNMASPSVTGFDAKTTLEGRGWTVSVN